MQIKELKDERERKKKAILNENQIESSFIETFSKRCEMSENEKYTNVLIGPDTADEIGCRNDDDFASNRLVLVHPSVGGRSPLVELRVLEPQRDLFLGRLDRVGSVADVAADLDAEIATNGAGQRIGRIGFAQHDATSLDRVQSLPDHRDHRTTAHVLDQTGEKRTGGQVGVVLLEQLLVRRRLLQSDQLESLLFESFDDLADQTALDAVRLDHDESALSVGRHFDSNRNRVMSR